MTSHTRISVPDQVAPAQPRAIGQALVAARATAGQSLLADLHHAGSARAMLPRTGTPDLQAVLVNTAGGVTGGDRFQWRGQAGAGAALTLSTQAAERAYRALPGQTGRVDTRLTAAPGATVHWLPQETIVFDGARIERCLDADLAPDATLIAVEPIIFGRTAMGERLTQIHLMDTWRIRRDGRLIFADALRISGSGEAILARPAVLAGARAMASLVMVGASAPSLLAPLRARLPETGGASLIGDDVLAARIVAPNGMALRRVLIPILEGLRGASLPKVWRL